MLNLKIGDKFVNVSDLRTYTIAHECSLCYYLCVFDGSSSKITNVSKSNKARFTNHFRKTWKEALECKIASEESRIEFHRELLGRETK